MNILTKKKIEFLKKKFFKYENIDYNYLNKNRGFITKTFLQYYLNGGLRKNNGFLYFVVKCHKNSGRHFMNREQILITKTKINLKETIYDKNKKISKLINKGVKQILSFINLEEKEYKRLLLIMNKENWLNEEEMLIESL